MSDVPAEAAFLSELICPLCRVALARVTQGLECTSCRRVFPIVLGIPDLRMYEDPLIPIADDYRKGERLLAAAESRSFAELVEYYWSLPTYPPTPPALIRRFVHHVLSDATRIEAYAEQLGSGSDLLDLGCGAGMLLRSAHGRFRRVTGCDVGFRWLIVARHGLAEAGIDVRLVCACAEQLPFRAAQFDTVTSVALLEHVPQFGEVLGECRRVVRPDGRTFHWTTNRYSLAPEPHVQLLGVGYVPRRWQPAYVRVRRGLAYHRKRLVSRPELARALRAAGFTAARFRLPDITAADLQHRSGPERLAGHAVRALTRLPLLGRALSWVAPALQVVARPAAPSAPEPSA